MAQGPEARVATDSPRTDSSSEVAANVRRESGRVIRLVGIAESVLIRRETGPILGLVLIALIFQAMSGQFITNEEFSAIVTLSAPLAIIAVSVAFLMMSGEYDLSVGGTYSMAPILFAQIMHGGVNDWVSLVVVLVVGAGIGLINGLITTKFRIPSLITTLAMLFILRGVAYIITGGQTEFMFGGSETLQLLGGQIGNSFLTAPVIWAVAITLGMWFVAQHTQYGNWTLASGARNDAPRAMGVPTTRVKVTNFMISATLSSFAGCAQFAAFGGASPGNGTGYELLTIVACVIGGTSLFGVRGTVIGAFIGAITLGALQAGLVLVGIPGNVYSSVIGVILIVTVIFNERIADLSGVTVRVAPWLAAARREH